MTMHYKIDWLRASRMMPECGHTNVGNFAHADEVAGAIARLVDTGQPVKRERQADVIVPYRYAYKFSHMKGCFYIPFELPRIGIGYQVTGSALKNVNDGWFHHRLLANAGFKFTRIDYAFDFTDDGEDIKTLTALVAPMFDGKGTFTVYQKGGKVTGYTVGSRQSDVYVRVYDKAFEQGRPERWIRCEVEVKGDRAEQIGGDYMTGFSFAARHLVNKCLPERITMVDEIMSHFQDGEAVDPIGRRIASSRERWLWSDVKSAFMSLAGENPEAAKDYLTGLIMMIELQDAANNSEIGSISEFEV